jgi:hypothetical protein
MGAVLGVVAALVVGLFREGDIRQQRSDAAAQWVDAAERAEARWQGLEETGQATLPGFPTRERWEHCGERAAQDPSCSGIWATMLRFLPSEADTGFALIEQAGAEAMLENGERTARALYVVAWGSAGLDRSEEGLGALALATAHLLGSPANRREALAGIEELRDAMNRTCGCAPPAGPLRHSMGPVAGLTRGAERVVRAPVPDHDPNPLLSPMIAVRSGDAIQSAWWDEPGIAGMLALELGRAGRTDQLAALVEASVSGPTGADRMAALWAARRVAPVDEWAHPEAQARARAIGW